MRVIAVSVFGSSYPELTEFRQRYRYAVISALGIKRYFAQDTEHINFYRLEMPINNDNDDVFRRNVPDLDVPFEWFKGKSKSGEEEQVLLLWLNEDKILSKDYGKFIRTLFNQLKDTQPRKFDFSVIGPTNTSLLVELMSDDQIDNLPKPFKIISSSATISDCDIYKEKNKRNDCPPGFKEEIKAELAKKSIIRTIGQDQNLAKALLWELGQRGVNREIPFIKDKCEDGLIIISEQAFIICQSINSTLH